jgi:hypothetical protein
LVLLGILGFTLGGIRALVIGLGLTSGPEEYGTRGAIGVLGGAVVGSSLALAFGDWKGIVLLFVAGAVGVVIGVFGLQGMFGESFMVGTSGTIILYAITGIIGGASLGAALGHLESRNLAEERRPRVR